MNQEMAKIMNYKMIKLALTSMKRIDLLVSLRVYTGVIPLPASTLAILDGALHPP